MFDYSIHKIYCPMCKRTREEYAKGSGANYYIKGHGENVYYKDTCSLCGKSYYLIAGHEGFIESRIEGIPMEEAIKYRIKKLEDEEFIFYGNYKREHELKQHRIDSITERCKKIYEMDEKDLVIPAELVNKDDLKLHSSWMS